MKLECPTCDPSAPCHACTAAAAAKAWRRSVLRLRDAERNRQAQAIVDRILAEAGCPKKQD